MSAYLNDFSGFRNVCVCVCDNKKISTDTHSNASMILLHKHNSFRGNKSAFSLYIHIIQFSVSHGWLQRQLSDAGFALVPHKFSFENGFTLVFFKSSSSSQFKPKTFSLIWLINWSNSTLLYF